MPAVFGKAERSAAEKLIELALAEDLNDLGDATTAALIDAAQQAEMRVVAREGGVLAGSPVAEMVFDRLHADVQWRSCMPDGTVLMPGDTIAKLNGPLSAILAGERTALNFLTHLSGVASLTRKFIEAVAGTNAAIYDTRKTLPGYRVLEKYAVRAGGGRNHRLGLHDGVLIKDNHLAALRTNSGSLSLADVVQKAREALGANSSIPVEIEVDTLEQLQQALAGRPDLILLDNMPVSTLRQAVQIRDRTAPDVVLEASGGVTLETVRAIAQTGVERISVGALTHSAAYLDIGCDWHAAADSRSCFPARR